jgi:transposase
MRETDWTKLLDWPGYRVYRHEIQEPDRRVKLWVRRKQRNLKLVCSGCGRGVPEVAIHEVFEREVRDLPCFQYRTTVVVEMHRVRCPECGVKVEKIEPVPSKAPFSKRFEDEIGQACESAAARQVARRFGLAASTVRAIDLRYLERWQQGRRPPVLRQIGVDEIHLGKKSKFVTVVSDLESGEPIWMGRDRKQETLDAFFEELSAFRRERIGAACVDMWEPYTSSIRKYCPNCRIVNDRFHIMQHANAAVEEVRRAEFFRKKGELREVVKGKRWLLLTRWVHLDTKKKHLLNDLFALNRRLMKAYLLKESLDRLWDYRYEGAMLNYLKKWIEQLKWQRLPAFDKLARTLWNHREGIMNYCRTKVRFGVVEALNANLKSLLRRGRGYKNLHYLLLKARRMTVTNTEFIALQKAA